jgi:diaminohydroxyphosphoribosylaminopyrimidine deaminase/5-amino-6-(5-phosphoribosylamino)uracil reductase
VNFTAADHAHMAEALRLAELGLFSTTPNPRVGCVIVKDNVVLGRGWHARAGEAHAEIHALRQAGAAARGATVYVSLEPCAHHGRTPPCADALIAAGVARVVAALQDPDPRVAGRGLARLAAAGIVTEVGVLAAEARALNIGFIARLTRGRPWLRLKAAASLDGRTALADGRSQWITGPEARLDGHRWRARACALLTGSGTVRADDPQLTVRDVGSDRQPLKVVVASRLDLPGDARFLDKGPVLIVSAEDAPAKAAPFLAQGAEWLVLAGPDGRVDLPALFAELGRRGINEVHGEAGRRLNGALLAAGLVDEILLYLAPCLIGESGRGLFDLPPLPGLDQRWKFAVHDGVRVGADLRFLLRPLAR